MPDRFDETAIVNPETAHERSDVNVRALLWAVAIFVVFAIGAHVGVYLLFSWFAEVERGNVRPQLTQVQRPVDANIPKNQPLLQPFPKAGSEGAVPDPNSNTPVTDLEEMRRREKETLETYGWVDRQAGVVRIPIEEAKRLALRRGFPLAGAVPPPPPPTSTGGER